jgi:hypothetical protein
VKLVWLTLLKSITITALVSTTAGYFLSAFGVPFIHTFVFCIAVQFLFFYFYGEFLKNKRNRFIRDLELKEIEEQNKQSTVVVCPCDRNIQTIIPIDIEGINNYICPGCDKNISVQVTTKTALATTPVTLNPLDSPIFLDNLEEKLKRNAN